MPLGPNLSGVNALGTSNTGNTTIAISRQVVSEQPASLNATKQVLKVPVALNKCVGFSSVEVFSSPNIHK